MHHPYYTDIHPACMHTASTIAEYWPVWPRHRFHDSPRPCQHTPASPLPVRSTGGCDACNKLVYTGNIPAYIASTGGISRSTVPVRLHDSFHDIIALNQANTLLLVLWPSKVCGTNERRWCICAAIYTTDGVSIQLFTSLVYRYDLPCKYTQHSSKCWWQQFVG